MRSKILTADVLFLKDEFYKLTELQREVFLDLVDPQPEVAPVKAKVKAGTTRKIEKCMACNYTRRAAVHKDSSLKDYHGFLEGVPSSKSKRASSLAEKIQGTAGTTMVGRYPGDEQCAYEIDGKVCKGMEDDTIHDPAMGYTNYHPFVSSSSVRPAVGQSSTSGSEVSSGTGSEDVSSVARG